MIKGEKLKELRLARGISQVELGRRSGIEPSRMSKLESNKGNISVKVLVKIIKGLKLTQDEIHSHKLYNESEILQYHREYKGMTKEELSKRISKSRATIDSYESREGYISLSMFYRISRILDIPNYDIDRFVKFYFGDVMTKMLEEEGRPRIIKYLRIKYGFCKKDVWKALGGNNQNQRMYEGNIKLVPLSYKRKFIKMINISEEDRKYIELENYKIFSNKTLPEEFLTSSLRSYRKRKGISVQDLAKVLHCCNQTVYFYELGVDIIPEQVIHKLGVILDLSEEEIEVLKIEQYKKGENGNV